MRHGLQVDRERGTGWMEGQNRPPAPGGDCGDPEQSLASTGVSVSQTSHGPSSHVPGRTRARTDSGWAISSGAPALGREKERSD